MEASLKLGLGRRQLMTGRAVTELWLAELTFPIASGRALADCDDDVTPRNGPNRFGEALSTCRVLFCLHGWIPLL